MLSLPRVKLKLEFERDVVVALATIGFVIGIYFWKLGSLTAGLGPSEAATRASAASAHLLYNNPVNDPHSVWIYLLTKLHVTSFFWLRSISAIFATIFVVCFYKIARSWFGKLVAWLSTLLLAATPLFILAGRSLSPEIMYLAPLALAALYFWLTRAKTANRLVYLAMAALAAVCLYAPGGIWLLAIGYGFSRSGLKQLRDYFPRKLSLLGALIFAILIAPLVAGLIRQPHLLRELAFIPATWPQPLTLIKQIAWAAIGLIWHSGIHPDLQIGRLPLLNAAQAILAVFGFMALFSRARTKTYGILAIIALGVIAAGINNNSAILLIALAPIMILVAAGLRYLLLEWQSIFPRNPIPRAFAYVLILSVCALSLIYGIRYSLVAWPNTVSTRTSYVLK